MDNVNNMIKVRLHINDLVELNPIFRIDIKLLALYVSIVINGYTVFTEPRKF